jgi:hypothetical protein
MAKPSELAGRGGCWFSCGDREIHLGIEDPFTPARKAHPGLVVRGLCGIEDPTHDGRRCDARRGWTAWLRALLR